MRQVRQLVKGETINMKGVGPMVVKTVAKHHIMLKDDNMRMKIEFACNNTPISDLGISEVSSNN